MELHNYEAERYLLGCIFYRDGKDQITDEIFSAVTAQDFHGLSNQVLFLTAQELYNAGKVIDIVTMSDELSKASKENEVGGIENLISISNSVISNSNYKHYLEIIKNLSKLRLLKRFGGYITEQTVSGRNSDELISDFDNCLSKITMQNVKGDLEQIGTAIEGEVDRAVKASKGEYESFGLRTGFQLLDKTLWGLQPGNMFVIAARPGIGKTAFALNVLYNSAVKNKKTCAFFSLEMPKEEISQRLLGIASGIDNYTLKSGKDLERTKLDIARNGIIGSQLYIDDTRGITVSEMLSKAKKLQRMKGLDLVVVDYLQIVKPSRYIGNPVVEIGEIAQGIKSMARQLKVPVIALAQLNRGGEKGKDGKPREASMSDLKGSGDIEQEADIIAFLETESPREEEVKSIYLQLMKFRNGHARNIEFKYTGNTFTFQENAVSKSKLLKISKKEQEGLPF